MLVAGKIVVTFAWEGVGNASGYWFYADGLYGGAGEVLTTVHDWSNASVEVPIGVETRLIARALWCKVNIYIYASRW